MESERLGTAITLTCAKPEKMQGLAVEKQNLTLIPEDLNLNHDLGRHELNLDNSGLKHMNKVSSKMVEQAYHNTVISCMLSIR